MPSKWINQTSFWYPTFVQKSAWLEHAPFAFWITSVLRPRSFVELGAHGGYSYFAFCQAVSRLKIRTQCYAVDTWKGDVHAGFYDEDVFRRVKEYADEHYGTFSHLLRMTFDKALEHVPDGSVDLLHIDGRHFYDDVKHDFESWRPKLSSRAVVLFHDTRVLDHDFGVHRLWAELSSEFPTFEFVHGHGLGVLGHGADMPAEIATLLKLGSDVDGANEVRTAYSRLGAAIENDVRAKQETRALQSQIDRNSQRYLRDLATRDRQIAAIRKSLSWRATAPLRAVSEGASRFLSSVRQMLKLHQLRAISQSASSSALHLYRRSLPESVRAKVPAELRTTLKAHLKLSEGELQTPSLTYPLGLMLRLYRWLVPAGIRARVPVRLRRALGIRLSRGAAIAAEAEAAAAAGNWPKASERWSAFIKATDGDAPPSAWVLLSRAFRAQGDLANADATLRAVPAKYTAEPLLLVERAEIATACGAWPDAVKCWSAALSALGEGAPPKVYALLSEAYRNAGDPIQAEAIAEQGLSRHPDAEAIAAEHAESAMARRDWTEAASRWRKLTEPRDAQSSFAPRAILGISVAERLANLSAYRMQIADYSKRRIASRSSRRTKKIVIYTAIISGYDALKLPEELDPRIDYVAYSDRPIEGGGIFEIRPVPYFHADPTRTARYIKTHPHLLLKDYDVAIWVDSNIMILDDLWGFIGGFLSSDKPVAAINHPLRSSVYEEAEACIQRRKDAAEVIRPQMERYRSEGFECDELLETNFIMFNLSDPKVPRLLNDWWHEMEAGSKRDQLSINYVLQKHSIEFFPLTKPGVSTRSHPAFALVPHDAGMGSATMLVQALSSPTPIVMGRTYADIREERIAAQRGRTIDIVVCVHNALADVKACLESICRARGSESQGLIIVDDASDEPTAEFLNNFVGGKPWIRLQRNEHAQGYTKAANQGLATSSADLVILLNSDTIVTDGWAEKMADAVFSSPGAGIVGPMSNAAGYQSIPDHRSSKIQTAINQLPAGLTPEDMNRNCERWSDDSRVPGAPLVHGFCFGVTREVIDSIGLLDDQNFPKGYGEENDYCFRAADAGFALVIATHTYIFHAKSKSYSDDKRLPLVKAGSQAFRRLYGDARVRRATQSMETNPILMDLRKRASRLEPVQSSEGTRDLSLGEALSSARYDFLDLGSSKGGSLDLAQEKLGGTHGIGLDRDPEKVSIARRQGFEVVQADALELHGHPNSVRFVVMSHFLEHLPGFREARQCIEASCVVARDFVFIKQPWFDADGELFRRGLKLYWSDWRGHPNRMTTLELHEAISQASEAESWIICGRNRITSSAHQAVHSLLSPEEQHGWEADNHPPKPVMSFDFPVFSETICLIRIRGSASSHDDLLSNFPGIEIIRDSARPDAGLAASTPWALRKPWRRAHSGESPQRRAT